MATSTRNFVLAAGLCVGLSAGSLALGDEPVYDAWAWLVWGRELAGLGLDASTGPSWKPLPVAITMGLSAAGDLAPALWIVLVRVAWLLALVLAAQLAYRLAAGCGRGARAAGAAFAALSLALLSDEVTAWVRQAAAGMSEPLLVALVLGAVLAGIDGRSRLALVLGGLAALVRPEAWPLLAVYAIWRWRAEPATRPLVALLAVAVPALWLGPDLLASGDALTGAQRARRGSGDVLEALGWAAGQPLALAWPLALVGLSGRDRDRRLAVLAAGVLTWIAIVTAMVLVGFPGLPRFMVPAAALAGVLGGAGLARALAQPRTLAPALAALVLAGAVVTVAQLPDRVAQLPGAMRANARIGASQDRLRALTRAVGRDALLRCGHLATANSLVRTALAWELDVPLSDVVYFATPPSSSGAFVVKRLSRRPVRFDPRVHGKLLGARGEWRVYSIDCRTSGAGRPSRDAAKGRSDLRSPDVLSIAIAAPSP